VQAIADNISGVTEEDTLRAQFYALLSGLLSGPPTDETLKQLKDLEGDETDIGRAFADLAVAASGISADEVEDEYNALFIGVTQGELLPYASHYLTGFLCEQPLADLRGEMAVLGISRADGVTEPEDHIASVLEIMHGLITGIFGGVLEISDQKKFFDAHLETWAPRFFEDLEAASNAALYRPVATIGRTFMTIEKEAFAMSE